MSEDLYQQAIVALARDPSHAGALEPAQARATRDNPLCGDRVTLTGNFAADGTLSEIRHKTRGCLLCEAGAALVAANAPGLDAARAARLGEEMRAFLAGRNAAAPWNSAAAFTPVRARKSRHDCVTLAFDALAGLFQTPS
ncbi:MAG: iron-sulfur cluster assembly scaffold protein [Reyranellaceae bacterium]